MSPYVGCETKIKLTGSSLQELCSPTTQRAQSVWSSISVRSSASGYSDYTDHDINEASSTFTDSTEESEESTEETDDLIDSSSELNALILAAETSSDLSESENSFDPREEYRGVFKKTCSQQRILINSTLPCEGKRSESDDEGYDSDTIDRAADSDGEVEMLRQSLDRYLQQYKSRK